jgi:hypothetical protein
MARGRAASAAIVLASAALLVMPSGVSASHVRPRGATPLSAPLVPPYKQCTAPNSTHGASLSYPSCSPPVSRARNTTIGTPDSNGAAANMVGSYRFDVIPGDLRFTIRATDVRCTPVDAAAICQSTNSVGGADYFGTVQASVIVRMTDHFNGPSKTESATMQDIPFPLDVSCANTASTSEGSTCTLDTTANAAVPGSVVAGKRTIWQLDQVYMYDGGIDGNPHTGDGETPMFVQGLFVP